MENYLLFILNKIKTWRETKAEVSKQPLSRENAYVLSTIVNKHGKYSDITEEYYKTVLKDIENAAKLGESYLLKHHPSWLSPSDKEALIDYLVNLGYNICYTDARVTLITWIYQPQDYTK